MSSSAMECLEYCIIPCLSWKVTEKKREHCNKIQQDHQKPLLLFGSYIQLVDDATVSSRTCYKYEYPALFLFQPGFEIVAVDGTSVKGCTHAEAVARISEAFASERDILELLVIPEVD